MSNSTSLDGSQRPAASLSAWRIEQLTAQLCSVQTRGTTAYCATHGNVVAAQSSMCGHVRTVVQQIVEVVMEAERLSRDSGADPVPGLRPVEVLMEVSA